MRRQLKRTARVALKAASVATDPLFGPFAGPRILIYHQVGVNFGREMEVSTEAFTRQIDWMQTNGEVVNLETAIERRGAPDADKLYVLSFDDGFEDVYDNAFPLMKERGLPFTLYLTTKPIETGEPLDPRYPDASPLKWGQVQAMATSGLATIGAHTHTHLDFRGATTAEIGAELDRSNELIRERTGTAARHFTYPWGWWAATADPLVRDRYASATVGGGVSTELYRLSRVPIQRSDLSFFFRGKIRGGLQLESRARAMLNCRKTPSAQDP